MKLFKIITSTLTIDEDYDHLVENGEIDEVDEESSDKFFKDYYQDNSVILGETFENGHYVTVDEVDVEEETDLDSLENPSLEDLYRHNYLTFDRLVFVGDITSDEAIILKRLGLIQQD